MNLRDFLAELEKENELIRINKEVSTEYDIANVIYSLNEKPVIFDNVKGYPFKIFGGITSDRDIIAKSLGTTKEQLLFKLVDALGNKNKKLALKLISDQLNLQANELYLLSMLIRQFKILLQIKDLQQTNPQINQSQLASTLKLHPFVTSKGINQAKNFSLEKLKEIYQLLVETDIKIKTSASKPKLLFDLLIAQI